MINRGFIDAFGLEVRLARAEAERDTLQAENERLREALERLSDQAAHVALGVAAKADVTRAASFLMERADEARAALNKEGG
jgi:hypothetical protein